MNGSHVGQVCHIPRIDLITQEGNLPFTLKRRQFPVMLAFAMTINKSQGQSMLYLGLFLPTPVFAHGQLYVALSRSGLKANTKIYMMEIPKSQGLMCNGKYVTRNVVYTEVLV